MKIVTLATGCALAFSAFATDPWCWYKFDDTADPSADASGNNNTVTLPASGARVEHGRLVLFGSHGWCLSKNKIPANTSAMTVEMFVRGTPAGVFRGPPAALLHVGEWGKGSSGAPQVSFDPFYGKLTALMLSTSASATYAKATGPTITGPQWHHVAYVYDASQTGAATLKFYVDGIEQTTTSTATSAAPYVKPWPVRFGGGTAKLSTEYPEQASFVGEIADYRVTLAVLQPDEFLEKPSLPETVPAAGVKIAKVSKAALDWQSDDAWVGGAKPVANDDVRIPVGSAVRLSSSTPALGSLSVEGTLVTSNWTTQVSATTVSVGGGGSIGCAGPFYESEMSNRVWIACRDLTVAAGGEINVSGYGYAGAQPTASSATGAAKGQGPGGAAAGSPSAYGGYARGRYGDLTEVGSLEYPVLPGSGGSSKTKDTYKGGNGGGAVRIDATGTVTVNGAIRANGEGTYPVSYTAGATYTHFGGTGGSVLIVCRKIAGSGCVTACGNVNRSGTLDTPSAGGRLAVHYDTSVQTASDVDHLFLSADAGHYRASGAAAPEATGGYTRAAQGTVWLPDATLVHANSLGTDFAGRLAVGTGTFSFPGNLVVTNAVGFYDDEVDITVGGNLEFVGPDGRFDLGAKDFVNTSRVGYYRYQPTAVAPKLTVCGNLTMGANTRLDIYSACTNATTGSFGAYLSVTGAMTMASGAYFYPFCTITNGATVKIDVGSLTVDAGAQIGMAGIGYGGGKGRGLPGFGPGYSATGAKNVQDPLRPTQPGSGGAVGPDGSFPSNGGAAVWIKAQGAVVLNGTIMADASAPSTVQVSYTDLRAGAGGGVLIDCKTFSGSGTITSTGASAKECGKSPYYAGDGGSVAVWSGKVPYDEKIKKSRYVTSLTPPETFTGTVTVAGGTGTGTDANGAEGTIRFMSILPTGLAVLIR